MNSAVPRTTSSMPSVTRKDGNLQPRDEPAVDEADQGRRPAARRRRPTSSEVTPPLKSVHISTGAKPNTEPTERSNSPDVISSVMASAIRPSSTVKASVLLMFCGDRKSWLIAQKTTSSTTSRTKRPEFGPGDQAAGEGAIVPWDRRSSGGAASIPRNAPARPLPAQLIEEMRSRPLTRPRARDRRTYLPDRILS